MQLCQSKDTIHGNSGYDKNVEKVLFRIKM